jgi:SAM-dependent methyltransferase
MPDPIENGSLIPTLDRQGAIWLYIDEVTQAYLDSIEEKTALEIAAGYGHLVIEALDHGARRLLANEIDPGQLAIIRSRTPVEYQDKLVCCLGEFPEFLHFEESSFDAIYNARLFHFFNGERIRISLDRMHHWLRPGGKVFLVNDAIYRTIFKPLIPI